MQIKKHRLCIISLLIQFMQPSRELSALPRGNENLASWTRAPIYPARPEFSSLASTNFSFFAVSNVPLFRRTTSRMYIKLSGSFEPFAVGLDPRATGQEGDKGEKNLFFPPRKHCQRVLQLSSRITRVSSFRKMFTFVAF